MGQRMEALGEIEGVVGLDQGQAVEGVVHADLALGGVAASLVGIVRPPVQPGAGIGDGQVAVEVLDHVEAVLHVEVGFRHQPGGIPGHMGLLAGVRAAGQAVEARVLGLPDALSAGLRQGGHLGAHRVHVRVALGAPIVVGGDDVERRDPGRGLELRLDQLPGPLPAHAFRSQELHAGHPPGRQLGLEGHREIPQLGLAPVEMHGVLVVVHRPAGGQLGAVVGLVLHPDPPDGDALGSHIAHEVGDEAGIVAEARRQQLLGAVEELSGDLPYGGVEARHALGLGLQAEGHLVVELGPGGDQADADDGHGRTLVGEEQAQDALALGLGLAQDFLAAPGGGGPEALQGLQGVGGDGQDIGMRERGQAKQED